MTAPGVAGGGLVTFRGVVQAAVLTGSAGVRMTFMPGLRRSSLADLVPGLADGAARAVVIGAEVGEAGGGVADEDPGDLADDPGDRDDGFLLAALAGDPPVHARPGGYRSWQRSSRPGRARRAGTGCPCRCGRAGRCSRTAGCARSAGPTRRRAREWGTADGSVPSSAMTTWALRTPTPVISSSRSDQVQDGRAVAGAAGGVPAAGQPAARRRPVPRRGSAPAAARSAHPGGRSRR